MNIAIIGSGVIGGGWAARFLLNGHDVTVYDPAPNAQVALQSLLDNARTSLPALYDRPLPAEGCLRFATSIEDAVSNADWIQESAPERLAIKQSLYAEIQQHAPTHALLASSTSGFTPSQLQQGALRPKQIIVAHPFNPVYLLPLVEVVGSDQTPEEIAQQAVTVIRHLGMHPLRLRTEIEGFIGNRLQEAVWRETLWLIKEGVATTEEIDDAIRYSFGLRWAQMGQFDSYRLAGGEAGLPHFLAQFGPSLQAPLSYLTHVPELDDALIEKISTQSEAQSGHLTQRAMEQTRDQNLIALIRALKQRQTGAGSTVKRHEATLTLPQISELPITATRMIPPSWTDSNGHMNEAHYIEVASNAADTLTQSCGVTDTYIANGMSHFTAETHVRYLAELHEGETVTVTTQVLYAQGKKTHLFHRFYRQDNQLAATVEMMILHVNLKTRQVSEPAPAIAEQLSALALDHRQYPYPEMAGGAIQPQDLSRA